MAPLLEIEKLNVRFGLTHAVRDVSLAIETGESSGVVGESGSGTSATALGVMRLLPTHASITGNIRFAAEEISSFDDEAMRRLRGAKISMIFQEPMTALNPVMRVGDQIAEAII